MILIGEKLNSSIPRTLGALKNRDTDYLVKLIKKQTSAGAFYLDVNTALAENEAETMLWLISLITEHSDCGIMLDTPNADVIAAVMPKIRDKKLIINSVTMDEKYDGLIKIAAEYKAGLVCLPMNGRHIPATAEERLVVALALVEKLRRAGVKNENIYMDALAGAIAADNSNAPVTLNTIRLIKEKEPQINIICGLSNISFGLPGRVRLNAAFLMMAMQNGLNSVIADVLSKEIQEAIIMARVLLGLDEYCMAYIEWYRG
jgi:5-methyltetrahydrofolate--homocysteine methyltransferase